MRFTWFDRLLKPYSRSACRGRRNRRLRATSSCLRVEALEDRCLLSTLTVVNNNDSGPGSLRSALASAARGDTVDFAAGISNITLTSGELAITQSLTITGPGASVLTLSGNNTSRVFNISGPVNVAIFGLTITQGRAPEGGGILFTGNNLDLTDCILTGNQATSIHGGAIAASGDRFLSLTRCLFSNNTAALSGGALDTPGETITITDSTFSGNRATDGGALSIGNGTITITNSTFSGNTASSAGGAINSNFNALFTVTNSTITANSSPDGGGVRTISEMPFQVKNTIIAGNIGTDPKTFGQGNNTILAVGGGPKPDISGTITSQGFNLIQDTTGGTIEGEPIGDLIGVAPNLGPLANNGGPTPTHALGFGSPALNQGDLSLAGTSDQRGFLRDALPDIGAYEAPPVFTWIATAGGSWSDPNNWMRLSGTGSIPDAPDAVALFQNPSANNQTVSLDGAITVGQIVIDHSANYTIVPGSGQLTFDVTMGTAQLTVTTENGNGTHTLSTPITLKDPLFLDTASTQPLTISGAIGQLGGAQGLTKRGSGSLILLGANTYTGPTNTQGGSIQYGPTSASLTPVSVEPGATLVVTTPTQTIGSLQGDPGSQVDLGPNTLITGGNNTTTTFSGTISGSGGLTKEGTGQLILTGDNPYSGPTMINAGNLTVTGSLANSDVTVGSDGTLQGRGTVGNVEVRASSGRSGRGGTVFVGLSPGILNTKSVRFEAGTSLQIELNGPAPGTGYDQLNATGSVDLGGADLIRSLGYTPTPGTTFTILNNDGTDPIVGRFNDLPEGAFLTLSGQPFQITYQGGDGNDVVLIYAPQIASAVVLTASVNPAIAGRPITLTATVSPVPPATGMATGTVTFLDGTTPLGTVALDGAGRATLTTALVTAGSRSLSAVYNGDTNFTTSTSASLTQTVLSIHQRLVIQVYRDLLQREVEAAGLAFWSGLLDQGVTRAEVVRQIESSREHQTNVVQDLYGQLLGRQADAAGLDSFVNVLSTGGTVDQVKAALLRSEEYFDRAGGTVEGFLNTLYQDVLGRALDASGATTWGLLLALFPSARGLVVQGVLSSQEAKEDLVQGFYQGFLGRAADDLGLADFVAALHAGTRQEDVLARVVGSQEYLERF